MRSNQRSPLFYIQNVIVCAKDRRLSQQDFSYRHEKQKNKTGSNLWMVDQIYWRSSVTWLHHWQHMTREYRGTVYNAWRHLDHTYDKKTIEYNNEGACDALAQVGSYGFVRTTRKNSYFSTKQKLGRELTCSRCVYARGTTIYFHSGIL